MNTKSKLLVSLLAAVILGSTAWGGDWPQWRGPNRDDKIADFKAPAAWPKELTQKWKVTVGSGDSSPILAADKIFTAGRIDTDEVTLCLDAATGKEIWRDKYAAPAPTGPDKNHPGPRGTPVVADGKLVVVGASGMMTCYDAAAGKVLWRKDQFFKITPPVFGAMSPIVTEGLAIAELGSATNGGIFAFDLTTGEQKWKWSGEGQGFASPSLLTVEGSRQIVLETDKSIVGLGQTDGKLLWQIPFPSQGSNFNAPSPIVSGATVIFTGQNRGMTAVKIEKQGDSFTATQIWKNTAPATQFNTPVIKDNLLYGLSDKGTFFCVKADTGASVWADTTKRGGNFGAILDAGSVMLALCSDSNLVAFKPGEKFEQVATIKVAATPTYAHPIITGNNVYVRDADSVILLTIE